jgi:hypothetical protein
VFVEYRADCSRAVSEKELKTVAEFGAKMQKTSPDFKGPISPEDSVRMVLDVFHKASAANGDGGSFVSHFGNNKQWV